MAEHPTFFNDPSLTLLFGLVSILHVGEMQLEKTTNEELKVYNPS